MLEERVGNSTTANKQFLYHPNYVDAIALRYWDKDGLASNGLEEDHYYLQDANFNVTAVTDNTGAVKERYAYTPYGEVSILDADFSADSDGKSDISNEHLYTGRRLDPETGLQLNRNRFYAAGLGRWVNRDPIGYDGGTLNLYEYVNGMPLVGVDPSGEGPIRCIRAVLECAGCATLATSLCWICAVPCAAVAAPTPSTPVEAAVCAACLLGCTALAGGVCPLVCECAIKEACGGTPPCWCE